MEERTRNEYVRRSQKDYSMSFKLRVVQEIESGELSKLAASRKYGIQGRRYSYHVAQEIWYL